MAGFIQNMIQNKLQDVAQGAAMYAITTGGRVVGDVVISAGDLIESSGRNVGDSIEGYIDRYGNWIRTYGNGVTTATAASVAPNGSKPIFQTKSFPTKDFATNALKALPAPNEPNVKALAAPGRQKDTNKKGRSQLIRADSDTKAIEALGPRKGLPSSGVKKALPAPRAATSATKGLSRGQQAKLRGIKRNEEKEKKNNAGPAATALPSPAKGVVASKPTATRTQHKAPGGETAGKGNVKPAPNATKGVAGNGKVAAKGGEANKENSAPTKPMYNPNNDNKPPMPFSTRTSDGKVKVSAASRPKKVTAGAAGGTAKAATGASNKGAGAANGAYNFLAQPGRPPKSEAGGIDFMKMYAPQSKKGAGSVKGGIGGANAKKATAGGKGGAEERAQSPKLDFF